MLCSEFIWWSCGWECGITQSGLNFLSLWLLVYEGQPRLLFVCMWQGLICCSIYLFTLFCKLSLGFAFFPTPMGSACSQPKTISTTNQIPCYSQIVGWFALPRNTVSCNRLCVAKLTLWSVFWVLPFYLCVLPCFSPLVQLGSFHCRAILGISSQEIQFFRCGQWCW